MSDAPCPHMDAILADDKRFVRGYYESGRERADLIKANEVLRQRVKKLEDESYLTAYTIFRESIRQAIGRYRPDDWRWSNQDLWATIREMARELERRRPGGSA